MMRFARWSRATGPLLAVILALTAHVNVATKAMAEHLGSIRASKLGGLVFGAFANQVGAVGSPASVGYLALGQKRKDSLRESGEILAAPLTDESRARHDAIKAEMAILDADLSRYEAQFEAERRAPGAQTLASVHDLAGDKPWPSFGAFLQAVRAAVVGGGIDSRLAISAATGMNEAIGPDGGFAVPVEYAPGIEKLMWETGQILSRVDGRDIGGNAITYNVINETSRADGSRRGGVLGYWIDEAGAPTATRPKLAQVELKLRKVGALGYMTEELMEDAPGLQGELTGGFAEELQFQVENKIIRGLGSTHPLGILNAPCKVEVAKETGQAAATIIATNLSKMWARLPARSQLTAAWFVNVDVQPQLDELSTPAGTGALPTPFIRYTDTGLTIKGRPVIAVEYCETLGTAGDIILADFSQYRLIRKAGGVQQQSSIHVAFVTGETAFRAIYRVDGQPMPRAAIQPFKGNNTLSPFVTLATRA